MDAISIVLACITLMGVINLYEKWQRKQAEWKRKAEEAEEKRAEDEYYRKLYPKVAYDVEFPNPATVPIERVAEFLKDETRIVVVDKYIEIAKEYKAPRSVIDLIIRKRQELQDLFNQAIASAGK